MNDPAALPGLRVSTASTSQAQQAPPRYTVVWLT
jgi:hypothetical protein